MVYVNAKGLITNRKPRKSQKKRRSNTKVPLKKIRPLKRLIGHKTEIFNGKVVIHLPVITVSEANNFDYWTKKNDRHKLQKRVVAAFIKPVKDKIILPCEIRLTRIAPRKLDRWDNLPMSVKYILDAICAHITGDFRPGRADDNAGIIVSYDQRTSPEYGVIIEITNLASLNSQAQNVET